MESQMDSRRNLILASFAFGLLWIAGMLWWNSPMSTLRAVMIIILGAVAGLLWYCGMRLWMRYFVQPLW